MAIGDMTCDLGNITNRHCAVFNGVDNTMVIGDVKALESTADFSISAWVYITNDSVKTVQGVMTKDLSNQRSYIFAVDNTTRKILFTVYKASGDATALTADTALSKNTWYHIACTYQYVADGSSVMNVYLNGVSDITEFTTAVGPPATKTAKVQIGSREFSGFGAHFNGGISDVRYYNIELTAANVLALYNETFTDTTGLVSQWLFRDNFEDGVSVNDGTSSNVYLSKGQFRDRAKIKDLNLNIYGIINVLLVPGRNSELFVYGANAEIP